MENYNLLTDIQLFEKITEGDTAAFEELYDRYSTLLYTLAKKIVLNDGAAETVLAEVFEIVWRKADEFNLNSQRPYTWLVSLTRNKAVDFNKSGNQNDSFLIFDGDYENKYIMPCLSPYNPGLMDLQESEKYRERIQKSLDMLTDAQKYVLYLAYYEGYTESDISNKTRIPLATIKSKIITATDNLRNNL